jgi:hypothetical protein
MANGSLHSPSAATSELDICECRPFRRDAMGWAHLCSAADSEPRGHTALHTQSDVVIQLREAHGLLDSGMSAEAQSVGSQLERRRSPGVVAVRQVVVRRSELKLRRALSGRRRCGNEKRHN